MNVFPYKYILLFVMSMTLAACGGGGGGNGSDNSSKGLSYTGKMASAIVSEENASELTIGLYAKSTGEVNSGLLLNQSNQTKNTIVDGGELQNIVDAVNIALSVATSENKLLFNGTGYAQIMIASVTNDRIVGSCGGEALYTLNTNEQTESFTGSFSYKNYCEDGITLNGVVKISGSLEAMTFSFNSFQIQAPSESSILEGTVLVEINGSTAMMTMNTLSRDDQKNKTFKMENLKFKVISGSGFSDITITGRFYDPEYGYVDITTPVPFRVNNGSNWPSSGEMLSIGKKGTVSGKTKARMIGYVSTYSIEVDTSGDGVYDVFESGYWVDI